MTEADMVPETLDSEFTLLVSREDFMAFSGRERSLVIAFLMSLERRTTFFFLHFIKLRGVEKYLKLNSVVLLFVLLLITEKHDNIQLQSHWRRLLENETTVIYPITQAPFFKLPFVF
jgi:hypothetical protein